jgi:hypothetical protein
MVDGFTTTCAISAYHHWCCEFESRSGWGVLDTTLCDNVCQWLAAGQWFSPGTPVYNVCPGIVWLVVTELAYHCYSCYYFILLLNVLFLHVVKWALSERHLNLDIQYVRSVCDIDYWIGKKILFLFWVSCTICSPT